MRSRPSLKNIPKGPSWAPGEPRTYSLHTGRCRVKLSILVPVYNEQDNLPELLSRLFKVARDLKKSFEIILIDDGSGDDSVKIIKIGRASCRERV